MQKFISRKFYYSLYTFIVLILVQTALFAQDSSVSTTTTTTSTSAQSTSVQPWVWIVGAIVLLIIIIALVRGNGGKDKVVVTKETTRES